MPQDRSAPDAPKYSFWGPASGSQREPASAARAPRLNAAPYCRLLPSATSLSSEESLPPTLRPHPAESRQLLGLCPLGLDLEEGPRCLPSPWEDAGWDLAGAPLGSAELALSSSCPIFVPGATCFHSPAGPGLEGLERLGARAGAGRGGERLAWERELHEGSCGEVGGAAPTPRICHRHRASPLRHTPAHDTSCAGSKLRVPLLCPPAHQKPVLPRCSLTLPLAPHPGLPPLHGTACANETRQPFVFV